MSVDQPTDRGRWVTVTAMFRAMDEDRPLFYCERLETSSYGTQLDCATGARQLGRMVPPDPTV